MIVIARRSTVTISKSNLIHANRRPKFGQHLLLVYFFVVVSVLCSQWCDRRALAVGTTSLMMMVMLRLLSLSCCCFNRKKQTTLIPTSVVGFEFGVFGLHKSICGVVWGVCCFILLNGNGGVEGILVWMGCFVWFLWCGEEMSKKCKVKMSNMCNKNK